MPYITLREKLSKLKPGQELPSELFALYANHRNVPEGTPNHILEGLNSQDFKVTCVACEFQEMYFSWRTTVQYSPTNKSKHPFKKTKESFAQEFFDKGVTPEMSEKQISLLKPGDLAYVGECDGIHLNFKKFKSFVKWANNIQDYQYHEDIKKRIYLEEGEVVFVLEKLIIEDFSILRVLYKDQIYWTDHNFYSAEWCKTNDNDNHWI